MSDVFHGPFSLEQIQQVFDVETAAAMIASGTWTQAADDEPVSLYEGRGRPP